MTNALKNFLTDLERAGFGDDDADINGADVVDIINAHLAALRGASPAPAAPVAPADNGMALSALIVAERFMRGFEGDEMQDGIDNMLALVRGAIEGVPAATVAPLLDYRQFGTVLAALRYWQRTVLLQEGVLPLEYIVATDLGTIQPLKSLEVEMLCERLMRNEPAEIDARCVQGLHSWIDEAGKLAADTPCTRCGELYGEPS